MKRALAPALLAVCAMVLSPLAAWGSASGGVPVAALRKGRGKVGMLVRRIARGAEVTKVVPNTPADRAGLRRWDRIVKVDGQALAKLSLHQIVARITGPPGTQVTLSIERGTKYLRLTLTRSSLKGALNAVLQDRKLARLVKRMRRVQGKISAVKGVELELTATQRPLGRLRMIVGKQGYRFELCRGGAHIAGGDDGQRWGQMPAEAPTRHRADDLMRRPYSTLPNLAVADFTDPNYTVKHAGRSKLYPPHLGKPLKVERFIVENEVYDFDVKSLRLIRYKREDGRVFYFSGWVRRSGVLVPTHWRVGRYAYKLSALRLGMPNGSHLSSTHPACGGAAKRPLKAGSARRPSPPPQPPARR